MNSINFTTFTNDSKPIDILHLFFVINIFIKDLTTCEK